MTRRVDQSIDLQRVGIMLKANVQELVENHLWEAKLKFDQVSNAGSPPLKGTRIIMYVDECYKLIFCI